jgi:thymidylate kinase
MITIKNFQRVRAVLEVQEGRRTSVGVNVKHGVIAKEMINKMAAGGLAEVGKKMFVVLEGPDLAGKSTLAADLSMLFKVELEKNLRIKDSSQVIRSIADQLVYQHPRRTGKGVLKDRWQYPSDIIYEELHGRTESALVAWEPSLLRELDAANVLFLYIKASPEALTKRLEVRGDDEIEAGQIKRMAELYENFFNDRRKTLTFKTIDTSRSTPNETLYEALGLILQHYKGVN